VKQHGRSLTYADMEILFPAVRIVMRTQTIRPVMMSAKDSTSSHSTIHLVTAFAAVMVQEATQSSTMV